MSGESSPTGEATDVSELIPVISLTEPPRLRALPCQIIDIDGGALVVRGVTEITVLGEGALETVRTIISLATVDTPTEDEIREHFAEVDREAVGAVVQRLVDRRMLIEVNEQTANGEGGATGQTSESSEEIFYWHFGLTEAEATSRLSEQSIVVLGLNGVSAQLVAALVSSGATNVTVVDLVITRNQRLFGSDDAADLAKWPQDSPSPIGYRDWLGNHDPDAIDLFVLCSDYAATSVAQEWNRVALSTGASFMPVMLRRMVGHVGPIIVPGHTACYDCMLGRENAHLPDHEMLRQSEAQGPFRQAVSGFHRSMASILGDIAALELTKFYTEMLPPQVGSRIDVSLLVPTLESRRVLRAPRCPSCSLAVGQPSNSLERADFIPGPQFLEPAAAGHEAASAAAGAGDAPSPGAG